MRVFIVIVILALLTGCNSTNTKNKIDSDVFTNSSLEKKHLGFVTTKNLNGFRPAFVGVFRSLGKNRLSKFQSAWKGGIRLKKMRLAPGLYKVRIYCQVGRTTGYSRPAIGIRIKAGMTYEVACRWVKKPKPLQLLLGVKMRKYKIRGFVVKTYRTPAADKKQHKPH